MYIKLSISVVCIAKVGVCIFLENKLKLKNFFDVKEEKRQKFSRNNVKKTT